MPGFRRRAVKKYYLKKSGERGRSAAKMNDANRALCWALRNPLKGKPLKYKDIRKRVRKTDGTIPSLASIAEAAEMYKVPKGQRGRPQGSRATTKGEDKVILQRFHKVRPPGHGVNSRKVLSALPAKIRKKIGRRTVIR